MDVTVVLAILWVHFVADFVLQTDRMAINKSKSVLWLGLHVAVYTVVLCGLGPLFAVVNGALHFMVDYVTSRVTSRLWLKGDRHNFFVVIGLDQALHLSFLFLTYGAL